MNTPKKPLFTLADEFIDLANQFVQDDEQDFAHVGAALRYAAARFNAHEASFKSADLRTDKDNAVKWFTDQYQQMFTENIDEQIAKRTQ